MNFISHEDMKKSQDPVRNHQLTLSLLNHGVQAGARFILTAAHSEEDRMQIPLWRRCRFCTWVSTTNATRESASYPTKT